MIETLGLYIQVPFCASKCSFCNFSSRVAPRDAYNRYCNALAQEIERLPEFYSSCGVVSTLLDAPVDSIYFGGGTPSLLGIDRLEEIVALLHGRFRMDTSAEFTLEVTPGSADTDFLKRALALGINRLSIGAQSFNDAELRSVGRLHSAEDTRSLVKDARQAGFANISLDLIAGVPHQSESSWQASLQSVIELRPNHVSVYLFEIDEKSLLGREVIRHGARYHAEALPDEDFMADAYEVARQSLRQAGYGHYEISNFALAGRESIHNRKYWQLKPYAGLGAGAHSCDEQSRWENHTSVEEYESRLIQGESPISVRHRLTSDALVEEFLFLGLRQIEGINLEEAGDRWGRESIERWAQKIDSLEHDGWIERRNGRVCLAENALLVSNEVFQEFIGT